MCCPWASSAIRVDRAVAQYAVTIPALKKTYKGAELAKILETLQRYERLLSRTGHRGYSEKLLHRLFAANMSRGLFADMAQTEDLVQALRRDGFNVSSPEFDQEHSRDIEPMRGGHGAFGLNALCPNSKRTARTHSAV